MTVYRLSTRSVKVVISADELHTFLTEPVTAPDSPQMLRLLAIMLSQAEHSSGIPFSTLPVTVELLTAQDGSLAAYFTAQPEQEQLHKPKRSGSIRLAARFHEKTELDMCCTQLLPHLSSIRRSDLYRYRGEYVLAIRLNRKNAQSVHHILLEYGMPFRLSSLNRARLSEYGECLLEENAIRELKQ